MYSWRAMNDQISTKLWQNSATEEVKFYFDPWSYDVYLKYGKTAPGLEEKSTAVLICINSYKSDCSYYQGILLLWTTYKPLTCFQGLVLYVDAITGDHLCGAGHEKPTNVEIITNKIN
jgi:hypothetical protein